MSLRILQIDPAMDKRWDQMVMDYPDGLIFHHSMWKRVIEQTYGHEAKYFAAVDANGQMVAGMPCFFIKKRLAGSRLISLPLADFCDPIYRDKEDLRQLYRAIFAECVRCNVKYMEFRMTDPINGEGLSQLNREAFYANHLLHLCPDPEKVQKKFAPDIKRYIRRAQNHNLRIVSGRDEDDLKAFYRLYVSLRKRHGLLPQPYLFFKNIWHTLKHQNAVFLTLVYDESTAIAATLNILFKKRLYLLYAGSDANAFTGENRARDHLITWTDILKGIEMGAELCDFGRTAIAHKGLMHFKKKWGTSPRPIYQFSTPETGRQIIPEKNTLHGTVLQKMTQNMPEPVLEFSGRLLYKYFL